MIIRSLSRKTASFHQLYHYINEDDSIPYFFSWNLNIADHLDEDQILDQFYENSECLKGRKNGNVQYHEIIAMERRPDIPLIRQIQALHDIMGKYTQARGPNLLAWGRIHVTPTTVHGHLMLSANEIDCFRPFYLSTKEYREIQKQCERYIRQNYPDLKQPVIYEKERTQRPIKSRQREYEYTRRTGKKTKKQQVKEKLTELLEQERDQSLKSLLNQHGFELYQRGKHHGVWYDGRKYRFQTLGLLEEFIAANERRKTPAPEPRADHSDEGKQVEKEESQQNQPKPEKQSNQTTRTTMDKIWEGIQEAELNKRAKLLEKLLNQKDLIKEHFPDLEYTVERNGTEVMITVFGETMGVEFPKESLMNISLGTSNEEILARREQIVKSAYEALMIQLNHLTKEHDWRKVREDLESAKEKESDTPEF